MGSREVKIMKLNLLFIVMELLILMAYPVLFVYSKLHQVSRAKASLPLANIPVIGSVSPGR